jgi:hypothetical protein
MGYNTTVVIMNDAMDEIEKDPEFGANLVKAVKRRLSNKGPLSVHAGSHSNAATVIEVHHADMTKLVAVGGNYGQDLGFVGPCGQAHVDMLEAFAAALGYTIRKKKEKCSACNGSGYYDYSGSTECGSCGGTGRK